MDAPRSPYLICATPGPGSARLQELLSETGVAGDPQEFFATGHSESAEVWEQRLQSALRDGATPNGVWGTTFRWTYWLDFLARLHERPGTASLKPHAAVNHLLPGVKWIHVRGAETIGPAEAIEAAQRQDRAWQQWLRAGDVTPIIVVEEDLAEDPDSTLRRVLDGLGIAVRTPS